MEYFSQVWSSKHLGATIAVIQEFLAASPAGSRKWHYPIDEDFCMNAKYRHYETMKGFGRKPKKPGDVAQNQIRCGKTDRIIHEAVRVKPNLL